ncbi:carbohydrate porin [Kozakia baliensis]|uniref:carbohydrate porin n=1 Tax=Kozakia baliensis TaxID=153496 RepID=UPI00345C4756
MMRQSSFAYMRFLGLSLITVMVFAPSAYAQYRGPISENAPSFSLDTPTSYENTPFTPPVEHMSKFWEDVQKRWIKHGVSVVLDYTSESAMALNGGGGSRAAYAHQIGAQLDIDWEKLVGWHGFRTHTVFINRAGHSLAKDFGDQSVNGLQEIYGGNADIGIKFVYVYATQDLMHDRMQIAFGKMPVNIDFSASPLYCTFMNNMICGSPKTLRRGTGGFANYPGSAFGTRIRYWTLHGVYFQAGLYGSNPDLTTPKYDRSGFNWSLDRYRGVYIPAEIGLIPSFGKDNLVGHYKFGFAYDSTNYSDNYWDVNGNPLALTGVAPRQKNGRTQVWLEGDQMLIRNGSGPLHGLYAMAGLIRNDAVSSPYLYQYYAGFVDRGFVKARPKDMLGIMFTTTTVSPAVRATQNLLYARGSRKLPQNASFPQSQVTAIELSYVIHVCEGLSVQPDYQHIMRPNLQSNKKDIDAVGLKIHAVL